jgi:integrating conjugative element relaxase (TIGR03760 family)
MFPLFSLFQRKKVVSKAVPPAHPPAPVVPEGFFAPETADVLLATPLRQKLLEHIWQRTSVSRAQFCFLYLAPIRRFAELVQSFPASESHHHAYPGGMLDHGLEAAAHALKLRQSHLLPVGAPPEEQAAQSEAWTAGVACAALMHDVGKVAVDLHVEFADGTLWHPWHGALRQPYRFRYQKAREYRLHEAAGGWLAARLFEAGILDWLCGYPDLWRALLYVWAGQYEHAGLLGEWVIQADRTSVAQAMGGDPARALAAPRHALQGKLLDGLRYLLKTELKLNRSGPSDGWLTREALWLVSKTVSDKLRAHLLSQGIEGIPSNNTAVFDVLQEHSIAQATPEGKAIWKATVTSDAGWSHPFTLLKLPPSLIWENDARPEPFAGSVTAVREDEEDGEEEKGEKDISGSTLRRGSPAKENVPNGNGIPEEEEEENADAFLDVHWADESPDEAEIGEMPTENRPFVKPVNPMPSIVPAAAPPEPETKPSGEHFMT